MNRHLSEIITALKTVAYCLSIGIVMLLYNNHKEIIAKDGQPPASKTINTTIDREGYNKSLTSISISSDSPWSKEEEASLLAKIKRDLKNPPIGVTEIKELIESEQEHTLIIDARKKGFYERSHIPKSINITLDDFKNDTNNYLKLMTKYNQIVIYCSNKNCKDSQALKAELEKFGLEHIRIFEGGYQEWKDNQN
jgi:rhodanese-related sulfurtransferase